VLMSNSEHTQIYSLAEALMKASPQKP